MSIWLHATCTLHHFTLTLRSFCLLKVAQLFKIASLYGLSGPLCDFGSALSVFTSISFLYCFFLPSFRVSLGILSSSLLGILSLDFSHFVIICVRSSFPPLLSSLHIYFPLSALYPLSQLGHIVQLAPRNSLSTRLSFGFTSRCPILSLLFLPYCLLPSPSSASCPGESSLGILLSSLLLSVSALFSPHHCLISSLTPPLARALQSA